MRIRIVQKPSLRDVDGIDLDCFDVGRLYEVGPRLAELFLAEGWAKPAEFEVISRVVRFDVHDWLFDTRRADPPNLIREIRPPFLDRLETAADFQFRRKPRRG
jgi:hypothetical protein